MSTAVNLSPAEFAAALVDSGDLDPVYVMLHGAGLDRPLLERWCLAYWCFYSAATASRVAPAEGREFWDLMRRADRERWPRGAERRHFRGHTSAGAIDFLAARFARPEDAVGSLAAPTFRQVSDRARAWPYFGPWVAFKIADMLERVLGVPVDFADCTLDFYAEPAAGAALVAGLEGLPGDVPTAVAWLLGRLGFRKAPPRYDRPLNVQEAETCFCKFKSHHAGRYPVGKDTREIGHALRTCGGGDPLCGRLAAALPVPP